MSNKKNTDLSRRYPHKITDPTVFFSACRATQVAAEMIVPHERTQNHAHASSSCKEEVQIQQELPLDMSVNSKTRYALLIGINEYQKSTKLRGCINDVNAHKSLILQYYDWQEENIRILRDADATKVNIIDNIRWLVNERNTDDILLIFFAGHGSWTLTRNGCGWECCLCTYDEEEEWDDCIITRTELCNSIIRPRGRLTITIDACFSGGMNPEYRSWRHLPDDVRQLLYGTESRLNNGLRATAGPNWLTMGAACRYLNVSRQQLMDLVQKGLLETRNVTDGNMHFRVK